MNRKTVRIFFLTVMTLFFLSGLYVAVQPAGREHLLFLSASGREDAINKLLPEKELFLVPFRITGAAVGKRYFPEIDTVIADDGQLLRGSEPTDPEFAAGKTEALYNLCRDQDINFLYVIIPGKPLYDEDLERYGISCARNYSADLACKELKARGIPVLDLRDHFRDEVSKSGDAVSVFYRTDHHWNADAGLQSARLIAGELNDRFGMSLRIDNLDEEKIGREVYPDAFVGEIGMKALGRYGGRDDFIRRFPLYDTHFRFVSPQRNSDETGGFEVFTDDALLNDLPVDTDHNLYYYYMYGNYSLDEITNKDVSNGDILMIKDSFASVSAPFLALTCRHLTLWDMRKDINVTDWIRAHPETETVIVVYNQSLVNDSTFNNYN